MIALAYVCEWVSHRHAARVCSHELTGVCTISLYVRTIKQDYLFQARTRIGNNEDHAADDEQAATMAG